MTELYDQKALMRQDETDTPLVNSLLEQMQEEKFQENNAAFDEALMASSGRQVAEQPEQKDTSMHHEVGGQIVGGIVDAVNEFSQAADEFSDHLKQNTSFPDLGAFQVYDKKGNFAPDYMGAKERAEKHLPDYQFPTTDPAQTIVGSGIRGISQFVTGLIPAMKAVKIGGAVSTASKVKRGITAAAITDFTFFDPHEERLSNFVEQNPTLKNPITKFLAADPNDSSVEGRFKNVLEGMGLEAGTAGLFIAGLKGYRAARKAAKQAPETTQKVFDEAHKLGEMERVTIKPEEKPSADIFQTRNRQLISETPVDEETLFDTKLKVGKKAYNINLARIESPDDIKKIINATSNIIDPNKVSKVKVTDATRGVQDNKATRALAEELGMKPEDLLNRKVGEAYNAEQATAARNLMVSSATNLKKLASRVKSVDATDVDRLAFKKAMATHVGIQREVSGLTAEAGRALQSFRIEAKSQREQVRAINDFLARSGGRGHIDDAAGIILDLAERGIGGKRMNRAIAKMNQASTFDMLYEVWVNSILSGPITHAVNVSSNALVAFNRVPETALASGFSKLRGGADQVNFGETGALMYGLLNGAIDGFRLAKEAFVNEGMVDVLTKSEIKRSRNITAANVADTSIGKYVIDPSLQIVGAKTLKDGGMAARFADGLGAVTRFPNRLLNSEDAFFKGINYRMSLQAEAYRIASREGLDGKAMSSRISEVLENPPESIRINAMDNAAINTFTNHNTFGAGIRRATDTLPISKFVVPFTNTPANIVKFSFERTPLAPLGKTFKDDIAAGGARADLALAKVTWGSMIMMSGGYLASQGIITGSAPHSSGLRNVKNMEVPPSSVKVGDTFYSYKRTDPLGMLLGISADMYYLSQEMDEAGFMELSSAVTLAMTNNVLSKTWVTGVTDLMTVLTNPITNAGEPAGQFENYFANLGSSFVPNLSRQINVNLVDPYMREADGMVQKAMTKIPGFSDELPLKRNIWGEPRIYTLTDKSAQDPVNELLVKQNVGVEMPDRNLMFQGMVTKLTGEEYSRYVELARTPAKATLDEMLPMLEGLDKEQLNKTIDSVIEGNAKAARAKLLKEYPEILDRMAEEKLLNNATE